MNELVLHTIAVRLNIGGNSSPGRISVGRQSVAGDRVLWGKMWGARSLGGLWGGHLNPLFHHFDSYNNGPST